jgi:GT2 family glycosyltransferase
MLGIVLVNYKTIDETASYIKQELIKITTPHKIVVVDVACEDITHTQEIAGKCDGQLLESLDSELDYDKKIYVLSQKDNLGYAKGNNLGAEFLTKHFDIEFFLFTNNDLKLVDEDVVERLIEKARQLPDVGAIGPKIVRLDGKDQSPYRYLSIWKLLIIKKLFYPIVRLFVNNCALTEVIFDAASGYYYRLMGSFIIIKTDHFIRVGGFDSNTFLYCEEKILSEKMRKIGVFCYYLNSVKIVHNHSFTTKKFMSGYQIIKNDFISNIYYFRKYRNASKCTVLIARISFIVFSKLYLPIVSFLKQFVKRK